MVPDYKKPGWSAAHASPFSEVGPQGEDLHDGEDGFPDVCVYCGATDNEFEDGLRCVRCAEVDAKLTIHFCAAFGMNCAMCPSEIRQGDQIVKVRGKWVHDTCAEDAGYEVKL